MVENQEVHGIRSEERPSHLGRVPVVEESREDEKVPTRAATAIKKRPRRLATLTPLDLVLRRAVTAMPTPSRRITTPSTPW
jgi:hypothetical protein